MFKSNFKFCAWIWPEHLCLHIQNPEMCNFSSMTIKRVTVTFIFRATQTLSNWSSTSRKQTGFTWFLRRYRVVNFLIISRPGRYHNTNKYLTRVGYLNFRIFSKWKGRQLTHRRLYKIWVLFTTKVDIKTKNPSFTILRLINSSNWGMFPKIPWLTLVNTYQISDYLKGLLSRPRILTFDFFF